MGRIRSIKPEILDDHKSAKLSDAAWRLWVSTWVIADDAGRLPGDTDFLRARVFWGDGSRALDECSRALAECSRVGILAVYEVDGSRFIEICNFTRHQKIDRPSPPKFPEPERGFILGPDDILRGFVEYSSSDRRGIGGDRKGSVLEGMQGESAPASPAPKAKPPAKDAKKPKRQLPADWQPSEAHAGIARERGVDMAGEAVKFRDWAISKAEAKADWDAAFRNWLRNAKKPYGIAQAFAVPRAIPNMTPRLDTAPESNEVPF